MRNLPALKMGDAYPPTPLGAGIARTSDAATTAESKPAPMSPAATGVAFSELRISLAVAFFAGGRLTTPWNLPSARRNDLRQSQQRQASSSRRSTRIG